MEIIIFTLMCAVASALLDKKTRGLFFEKLRFTERRRRKLLERFFTGKISPKRVQPFLPGCRDENPVWAIEHYQEKPPNLIEALVYSVACEFVGDQLGGRRFEGGNGVSEKCKLIDHRILPADASGTETAFAYVRFSRTTSYGPNQSHQDAYFFLELSYDRSVPVIHVARYRIMPSSRESRDARGQAFESFVSRMEDDPADPFRDNPDYLAVALRHHGVSDISQISPKVAVLRRARETSRTESDLPVLPQESE